MALLLLACGKMTALIRRIEGFWAHHPALFIGITLFLGTVCSLQYHCFVWADFFLIPFFLLLFPLKRAPWALLLFACAWAGTSFRVHLPIMPISCSGSLVAEVQDRHLSTLHGQQRWKTQLYVHSFSSPDGHLLLKGICLPVSFSPPCPLSGGVLYQLSARMQVDDLLRVRLQPFLGKEVHPFKRCFSLVEWRVGLKGALEKIFVDLFPDTSLRQAAGGVTFGLYKDPLLQQAMHKAGVEHVLAVSGFHFGIVAALTAFFIHGIAPKLRAGISMVFLTAYLLIIGPLPSVIRAWCAAMVVLGGVCFNRRASGLQCLGIGLIAAVLYDPSSISTIGFQLSFLATAAILFFSRPVLKGLRAAIPRRDVSVLVHFSRADQILLYLLQWFLPALSLLLPVFAVVCPYQLAFLQDFSLLGAIYNLIIPALFSLAMPPIFLAVLFYPLPLIPHLFAFLATIPLRLALLCVENTPETSWSMMAGGVVPHTAGCLVLLCVFLAGIVFHGYENTEHTEAWKACL